MHNNTLLISVGVFFLAMLVLVGALVYSISQKQTNDKDYIEDQPLKILNTIEGIEGPAVYLDERLRTSLYNCNKTDKDVVVISNGVFRNKATNTVIVIDPASVIRPPGCQTTIRMSAGTIKDRGMFPGEWTVEGTRSVKDNAETLQTITFNSESFKVVSR